MRWRGLFLFLLFISVFSAFGQDSIANEMLTLLNIARRENASPMLYFNPQLQTAAQIHSDDMASAETLAHLGTDGSQFWQRIQDTGYPLITGAENVLSRGDTNAQAAFQQWFNSEAHRQNMLNAAYVEVGIAYARSASGRYYFTMVLAARENFIPPTAQAATLMPTSSPLPSLTPTLTPSPRPTDALALTLAAPLPTNTINPSQIAIAAIYTNTPFPTATEALPPDIRLIYDSRSFSIINISGRVLNLANLAFESASGSLQASRWNTDFLSQPLSSFINNDCLQAWGAEFDLLSKPQECRIRHGWISVPSSDIFWQNTELFTVLNNNEAVGYCLVNAGVCELSLEQRLEEIALVNPATVNQPSDLRLEYNSTSFSIINTAERALDLRGLVFTGTAAGTLTIETWESQFLSQPLSGFTAGDCLQAWGLNTEEQAKPSSCRYRHAWILLNDSGIFWRDDFLVSRNGVLLARCFASQATCNVLLSANYGNVSEENSSSNQRNDTVGMRLVIRPESVTLINLSGSVVDISALAFESDNGVFAASRWQSSEMSAALSAFPNEGCLQVWGVGAQMQAKPNECSVRHAWVAVGEDAQFWRDVTVFRVRNGGNALATCDARLEICDFSLP